LPEAIREECAMDWERLRSGWTRIKASVRNRQAPTSSDSIVSAEQRRRRRDELVKQIQQIARDEYRRQGSDPGRKS
jgi:hypothetical protein